MIIPIPPYTFDTTSHDSIIPQAGPTSNPVFLQIPAVFRPGVFAGRVWAEDCIVATSCLPSLAALVAIMQMRIQLCYARRLSRFFTSLTDNRLHSYFAPGFHSLTNVRLHILLVGDRANGNMMSPLPVIQTKPDPQPPDNPAMTPQAPSGPSSLPSHTHPSSLNVHADLTPPVILWHHPPHAHTRTSHHCIIRPLSPFVDARRGVSTRDASRMRIPSIHAPRIQKQVQLE